MASKYLNSLSEKEYEDLTLKLLNIQNHKCFIWWRSNRPKVTFNKY